MNSSTSIFNHRFPLDLYAGTIVHVDRYTDVQGGAFNLPVTSTLHTTIVFRAADTEEEVQLFAEELNLPLYPTQQIHLLAFGNAALGFVDLVNGRVYYAVRNITRLLRIGVSPLWTLAISLVCAAIPFLIFGAAALQAYLLPFAITWILYFVQNKALNHFIKREIKRKLLK